MAGAGATLPKRDSVDARIIAQARDKTGRHIDSQNEAGGWPELNSAPAPLDSDGDGLPDGWERARGLKLNDPSDGAGDKDGDGYTNLEEWLNGTDASVARDYQLMENNVDALSGAGRLQRDIAYGEAGGEKLLLDAFTPAGEGPFPAAMVIHGGGWGGGDKADDTMPLCEALGRAGFAWFAVNYRLAPAHRWPASGEDVVNALRWVKRNAANYGADPDRLALVGYSAGGHLAVHAATNEGAPKVGAVVAVAAPVDLVADTTSRGGLSPSLQALLEAPAAPSPEVLQRLAAMSPLNQIRAGLPPFLMLHGTSDKSVAYGQSLELGAKLKAAGVPFELITLENAPHRLADWPQFDAGYGQKMTDWLRRNLG